MQQAVLVLPCNIVERIGGRAIELRVDGCETFAMRRDIAKPAGAQLPCPNFQVRGQRKKSLDALAAHYVRVRSASGVRAPACDFGNELWSRMTAKVTIPLTSGHRWGRVETAELVGNP